MKFTFGFIGCGNMGGALARAAAQGNPDMPVGLCDHFAEKAEAIAAEFGNAQAVSLPELVAESRYLFIGVKPQMLEALFGQIRELLAARKEKPVLVSMAAGTSIEKIRGLAGSELPVIRIMPNTPAGVGKGMILYAPGPGVSREQEAFFTEAMGAAGLLDSLEEGKIDAASAVSGCGPAFVYMFAEALADGAVECGLPRDKALRYAAQTLEGAAEMLLRTGQHPGALKDAVCSPGGTTIAGVHALEDRGFRGAVMEAVKAAYDRTLALK